MAMHNFGLNSLQHEQLKHQQQSSSGGGGAGPTDTSSWHNNNNSNNNKNNNSIQNLSNNDLVNDPQQSSAPPNNNIHDHKISVTEGSTNQANSNNNKPPPPSSGRHQPPPPHQQQSPLQSQQYHGIFSPHIPASFQSSLTSRVDQIIRTTLHDSPAYTSPTSKNSNNTGNNNEIMTSGASNMPLSSASSSLIFNATTSSTSNTTSTPRSIIGHPPPNSNLGLVTPATPIISLYGSTLNMGDTSSNGSNSNHLAKTPTSHSAFVAAATLQSLNQSHVQRSQQQQQQQQQQQMAHTQPSPYTNITGSNTKPPSNGFGTPVPQAAHSGSHQQLIKLNVPTMGNPMGNQNHLPFANEQSDIGSLNFSSRSQPNNPRNSNNSNNKMPPHTSSLGLANPNWPDQVNLSNGILPRLPSMHGPNSSLPPYSSTPSAQSPYGLMSHQLTSGPGSSNGNNMIGLDSDRLAKLNAMRNSPGQGNPMQFRDEKSFPINFPTLMSNKQQNFATPRGQPLQSEGCPVTEEQLAKFAYELFSLKVQGKDEYKKIIQIDEDMKNSIQNGEFYSKYAHVANGILTNQVIMAGFSIIDYLRRDRFPIHEIEHIERINRNLGGLNLICLHELVRQRPWLPEKVGPGNQIPNLNAGGSTSRCQPNQMPMTNLQHNSPLKNTAFLSSSPNRYDLLGPQGIDKSRRSSQSPSDNSRSQLGNNPAHSKFLSVPNPNNLLQAPSLVGAHQFAPPMCPSSQQQHASPPAAHQSSSRPNLASLAADIMPAHAHSYSVPVLAHMSSKIPQIPKLRDNAQQPSVQLGGNKLAVKEPILPPPGQQTSSRSIITGSGSTTTTPRRNKKAKPSPPVNVPEISKASTSDLINQAEQRAPLLESEHVMNFGIGDSPLKENLQIHQSIVVDGSLVSAINPEIPHVDSGRFVPALPSSHLGDTDARVADIAIDKCKQNTEKLHDTAPGCRTLKNDSDNIPAHILNPQTSNANDNTSDIGADTIVASKLLSNSSESSLQANAIVDQPSKYQKLFTKKAWLKNYNQEDHTRVEEEQPVTEDKMVVASKNSSKVENIIQPATETDTKEDKQPASVKSNGGSKNSKSAKADSKKKTDEIKTKKTNSSAVVKAGKVTATKSVDNDSEETNASTSDMDDTDETDSLKSSSDKKLRRMPRRKVKLNSDRESSEQPSNMQSKSKTPKECSDKDAASRRRGKKDTTTSSTSEPGSGKRKLNSDDESVKQKSKKIKDVVSKNSEKSDTSVSPKSKKRAGEKFLQVQPCYEIVPKSIRCLECRRVRQSSLKGDKVIQSKQASKTNWDDFCRFFEFRKLRYNKSGQIVVAGFSEASDAKANDMNLWLPLMTAEVPENITYKVAKFILANIGDEFCNLVLQERAVLDSYERKSGDKRTTWKRAVNGLRELCDVCSTTLFNCHYVCDRCGFVVCIDCHESRAKNFTDTDSDEESVKKEPVDAKTNCENSQIEAGDQVAVANKKSKKDKCGWIFCAKNEEHSHNKLTLAKIIAGNCLEEVWTLMHEIRDRLDLGECSCKKLTKSQRNKINESDQDVLMTVKQEVDEDQEGSHSTLKGLLLAATNSALNGSVDVKQEDAPANGGEIIEQEDEIQVLRDGQDSRVFDFANEEDSQDDSKQVSAAIEGCIASLSFDGNVDSQETNTKLELPDIDLTPNFNTNTSSRLCDGDLLVLNHARHKDNIKLFREHWRHGKPVMVRGVHERMNIEMWLPQFFLGKFGEYRSDLVDCRNGDIHRQSMRKYWDGFEPSSSKKRVKEDTLPGHIPAANNEEPSAVSTSYYSGSALWRLKDWPPGQDFNEILPEHYNDFMNNLPLKSYTTRTGRLNLACRLPKEMLKPDLGPKMYSAYGTTKFPERGTTNLHLDISDAVNVMVYVGGAMPFSLGSSEYSEIYESTINDCYVDAMMKEQIRQKKLIPGALWHIFKPSDVAKIRDFLNKVSDECKISPEKRIDPIHDQTWYLDQNLLDRLQREHGVKSYAILQCMGDAILIPAGAPHQVKNLQNCIKVANDFVSPENIKCCLQLTNEFRNLPETHINQEDKLQIKNIMYHSVKESIQYSKMFESGKVSFSDESSDEDD